MTPNTLRLDYEAELVTLTLHRPEKRNAISEEMADELKAALDEIEASAARVLILTGAGKAFCAGMDLGGLQAIASRTHEENFRDARRTARLFRRIYSYPKPIIAAVNGAAMAGGCGLATLGDFTLAAEEATFGYTEVRVGFIPALISVFVIRQIGEKRARDLLLSGRIISAAEARDLGLVNEIVPQPKLLGRAHELAASLLALSPASLQRTKRLLWRLLEADLDRELELAIDESARIRSSADFHEGLAAFLEKRQPRWQGGSRAD